MTKRKKGNKRSLTRIQTRAYDGAANNRLTPEPGIQTSSSDTELAMSLASLRNRSRALVRNSGHAKRARRIIELNVIGPGIGLQGAVSFGSGRLYDQLNDTIESEWKDWCMADNCHVAGQLHFSDMERLLIGEVFEAGEVFVRIHRQPFGGSRVPLALEVIEPERIADDWQIPSSPDGRVTRLGVEQDRYGRPTGYWLNSIYPGETRLDWSRTAEIEYVPAEDMIHLYLVDRWPQSRGEPWMHAAIRKLQDTAGYSQAEIVAARAAAYYMGFITSEEAPFSEEYAGDQLIDAEPGEIRRLSPGESFAAWNPNRPNSQADPFLRFLLREIAAGIGVSYESLSRDYSQSNYSSSRLALLDDRDLWKMLQLWFIRSFRERLHRVWIEQAAVFGALGQQAYMMFANMPQRLLAARYKPRGWTWIDPTKEVSAYKEAERAGYITKADIIAATGGGLDLEDVLKARRRELDMLDELDLRTDTTEEADANQEQPAQPAQDSLRVIK